MNHTPVLLDEVLKTLGDPPLLRDGAAGINGKTIVDCTFGAGGYSRAFLERGANVIAFDRDASVIPHAEKLAQEYGDRLTFINAPFSQIQSSIINHQSSIHAIVFDLGISSMQIDTPERGFSWRFDAPLDMRMNQEPGTRNQEPVSEMIKNLSEQDIAKILRNYGDVKNAGAIARAMKDKLPTTTFELKELIYNPKDYGNVFQALRIAVNDEMGEIELAMNAVPEILAPGGMCIAVTFHSLEDRLIKNIFRDWTTAPGDPRMSAVGAAPFNLLKTYTPSDTETQNNPRARSAHLRAMQKA